MARTGRAYPTHPVVSKPLLGSVAASPPVPKQTVVQARPRPNLRRIGYVKTGNSGFQAATIVVRPRGPYVVQARAKPPITRREYKPVVTGLQYVIQTFVRPPLPTVILPRPLRKLRPATRVVRLVGKVTGTSPVNTVAPVISGLVIQSSTLSCTTGTWTGTTPFTYTYQWQRDVAGNGVYSNISLQVSSLHTLDAADVGCNVRCVVTATNVSGAASANSNSLGPVPAIPSRPYPSFHIDTRGAGEPWNPDLPLTPMRDKQRRRQRGD